MTLKKDSRRCRSCPAVIQNPAPEEIRCGPCQARFEKWLKSDYPGYRPQRNGVYYDDYEE